MPSLLLNWILGPALMFSLAWVFLPDLPAYRTGLIIVGLARCIAMVIIWNDLAGGDREAAAVLVALNSVFQVLAFAGLGWFYLFALPGWLGLATAALDVSTWTIARSVLVFLGIPLLAGYLSRRLGERAKGRDWYETRFLPKVGPVALYGLLFTIVILFALQGGGVTSHPLDVARIALPLLAYFAIMWTGSFAVGKAVGLNYERTTTLALFVCVHNAGRSQMAAALLDRHAAGRVHVRSAGSIPAAEINPAVRAAMAELGLDLSVEYPKPLTDDVVQAADVVITMGCGDACPVYPGKRYLDWDLPDPAGKNIEEIRPIRDEIDHRVRTFLKQLVAAT